MPDSLLSLHHEGDPPPEGLPSLSRLYAEARTQQLAATLVTHPAGDASRKALAKRRHDVKAALRTFGFTLKAIEDGYKFDDDKKVAKTQAIAKALAVLEKECELLCAILHEEAKD